MLDLNYIIMNNHYPPITSILQLKKLNKPCESLTRIYMSPPDNVEFVTPHLKGHKDNSVPHN